MIKKLKELHLLIFLKMIPDMVSEYWNFARETVRCNVSSSKTKQLTEILMLTHAIEKGFSLKNIRVNFGVEKMTSLVNMLCKYVNLYGYDDSLRVPISLVYAYQSFRMENQIITEDLEPLFTKIDKLVELTNHKKEDFQLAGTITVRRKDLINLEGVGFEQLSHKRHAIRNFSKSNDKDLEAPLIDAINMAKYAPSACNRQAYRVHIYKGEGKTRLLKAQGSAAFSEDADYAVIITGDMNRYYTFEQHLLFVDASLFAMSLMYALTAKGIATIPLTQCIRRGALNSIRKEFCIPKNEIPVIMLAVGHYPEEAKVSRSERMPLQDFTVFH